MAWTGAPPHQESEQDTWSKKPSLGVDGVTCSGRKQPMPPVGSSTRKPGHSSCTITAQQEWLSDEAPGAGYMPSHAFQRVVLQKFLSSSK
jgi:hypothetical protein